MLHIGILSDTHGYIHPKVLNFFRDADEIWHAGDIGNIQTAQTLAAFKPLRAVYGNIDGQEVRKDYPQFNIFQVEQIKILMTHIGGYPGRYDAGARQFIINEKPGLFVCGHSHILKVIYDPRLKLLHINPGAAGKSGLHRSITAVRLIIDGTGMKDLEILDIPRNYEVHPNS